MKMWKNSQDISKTSKKIALIYVEIVAGISISRIKKWWCLCLGNFWNVDLIKLKNQKNKKT